LLVCRPLVLEWAGNHYCRRQQQQQQKQQQQQQQREQL
jgi:hypothetical protein